MVIQLNSSEMWPTGNPNPSQFLFITSTNDTPNSPLDLSKTSIRFPFYNRSMAIAAQTSPNEPRCTNSITGDLDRIHSFDISYDEPEIVTQPKSDWHYRSIKDLAKKHIPLLSGDGPQRTPIRILVPSKSHRSMYLGVAVVTHDKQTHYSKVIVPPKTRAKIDEVSHDNNLDCLNFDDCNQTDYFERSTRHVYLYINDAEHEARVKEVRIHMFNLYQNQTITKDIIEAKQLDLCKLAFWLCYKENEHYIPISPVSFSVVIREKKLINRPRQSQSIVSHKNYIRPYSIDHCDSFSQECKSDDFPNFES